eukprot:scaffold194838_cov30-Tisochrysis_lutea.AAC.3
MRRTTASIASGMFPVPPTSRTKRSVCAGTHDEKQPTKFSRPPAPGRPPARLRKPLRGLACPWASPYRRAPQQSVQPGTSECVQPAARAVTEVPSAVMVTGRPSWRRCQNRANPRSAPPGCSSPRASTCAGSADASRGATGASSIAEAGREE